ncbi:MAG: putative peptidoglycan glycosyltransferase FtsW [Pseudomonadota bacterium]
MTAAIPFARTDQSALGRWWWTVDRWSLAAVLILIAIGAILLMAASPSVAERIGLDRLHFVNRQLVFLPLALLIMVAVSLLSPLGVRRFSVLAFIGALVLTALTPILGAEIKGAQRWLSIVGFSLQPSEFLKPTFAVAVAWMMSLYRQRHGFPGHLIALGMLVLSLVALSLQPDFGMAVLISAIWAVEIFVAGLPMVYVVGLGVMGIVGATSAYFAFPHVASRIDRFIDPASGDSFQVDRSLAAFANGGFFGRGPGEGTVKETLPDAHADFIFAVAGEEFGLVVCGFIVLLFGFIVLRGMTRALQDQSLFVLLATAGLLTQFGLQALINLGSTLNLMPTKGMTLPFISYGGSSMIAVSLGMGMVLALTRRRPGVGDAG